MNPDLILLETVKICLLAFISVMVSINMILLLRHHEKLVSDFRAAQKRIWELTNKYESSS